MISSIFIYYFLAVALFITTAFLFFLYIFMLIGFFITKVPFVNWAKKDFPKILEKMDLKQGEIFVDLGCGDATLLIEAEKRYKVQAIGYEISLPAYLIAKMNVWLKKSQAKIYFKNFYKADLSQTDVVFCYLFPSVMKKVGAKLKQSLKPGARVFSLAFHIPDWPGEKVVYLNEKNKKGEIFIYRK